MKPLLITPRLQLQAISLSHQNAYCDLLATPEIAVFLPLGRPYSKQESLDVMQQSIDHWKHGFGTFMVSEGSNPDDVIGYVGIELCPNPQYRDIRFAIKPSMQGKGFAKEAAQAIIQEYFVQNSESILGVAIDSNEASLALLSLLGFCNDETATPYSSREGLTILQLNKPIYSVK